MSSKRPILAIFGVAAVLIAVAFAWYFRSHYLYADGFSNGTVVRLPSAELAAQARNTTIVYWLTPTACVSASGVSHQRLLPRDALPNDVTFEIEVSGLLFSSEPSPSATLLPDEDVLRSRLEEELNAALGIEGGTQIVRFTFPYTAYRAQ